MTKNRRNKEEARKLAEETGLSFVEARRLLSEGKAPEAATTLTGKSGWGHTTQAINCAKQAIEQDKPVLYLSTDSSEGKAIDALYKAVSPTGDYDPEKIMIATPHEATTIATPLDSITSAFESGWRPGVLITAGSRPGGGKTTFALRSILEALKAGSSVLYICLELNKLELIRRFERFEPSLDSTQLERLTVVDNAVQTVDSITESILSFKKLNEGPTLVVIDYLQLITCGCSEKHENSSCRMNLSRDLKKLAVELQVPIMALIQTLRNEVAFLASSSIMYDSDVVFNLRFEDETIELTVLKNRYGLTGEILRLS